MSREFIIPRPNATNGRIPPRRPEYNNHVIFPTPAHTSYRLWLLAYHKELFDIYQNYRDRMNEYYPENTINWDSVKLYNEFTVFIYQHSSKYIIEPEHNMCE